MRLFNVKILILIIFVTGILQMDILNIKWQYLSTISIIHACVAVVFSVFYIIPFVNKHAYKYIVIRKVNSLVGWILGFILLIVILSGFYLFLVGNRGGDILGIISFNVHLYGSFVLIAFLLYHTKDKVSSAMASLFLILTFVNPTPSYSFNEELVSMKLENDKIMYHNEDWTNSTKCKSCNNEILN